MNYRRLLFIIVAMLLLGSGGAQAQYSRSGSSNSRSHSYNNRYSSHRTGSDMLTVRLNEEGTLEREVGEEMFNRVRYLRIDGPLNSHDFRYLRRLLGRSKCVNDRGKSIDNYIDLDLERAMVNSGKSSRNKRNVLEDRAFESCSHLRSIVLPDRLREVGERAFGGCGSLEEVYMPNTVRVLGERCFENCGDLEYIDLPEGLEVMGDKCLYGCDDLTNITLPTTLRELGKQALSGTGLQTLTIPAATGIVDNYLGNMPKLKELRLTRGNPYYSTDGVSLLDRDGITLLQCPAGLTGNYTVGYGIEAIGPNAFTGCKLTTIELPGSLLSIGAYAFQGCNKLTSIVIPDGVEVIPAHAFEDCTAMEMIDLPPLSQLGESAFKNCRSLVSVNLQGSLTTVSNRAFESCKALTRVILPPSITVIDEKAFHECSAMTTINISETNLIELKKEAMRSCKGITHLELPATTTTLGKEALRECKNLASIDLNQVERIGENALRETAITTLVLPASVTSIGKKITEKCSNLQRIECHATTPPSLDKVSNDKVTLAVPAGSVATYQTTRPWKEFKTIVAL